MDNKSSTGNVAVGTGNGSDAFEAFQNGASVDEINERFFYGGVLNEAEASAPHPSGEPDTFSSMRRQTDANSSDGGFSDASSADGSQRDVKSSDGNSDTFSDNSDESNHNFSSGSADPESGSDDSGNESVLQAGSAGDGDASDNTEVTDVTADDVKLFSQSELDSIVGRRIDKERRMRGSVENEFDSFASEVAKFLGVGNVSKEELRNELIKAQIKNDAENEGIVDSELYERARLAEMERDRVKTDLARKNEDEAKRNFADVMSSQIVDFEKKYPDVDVVSVSMNDDFNEALRYFYSKESTRGKCFEMAFRSLGDGNFAKKAANSGNGESSGKADNNDAEKKKAMLELNKQRASESASSSRSPSSIDKKFDFSKMTSSDFDDIMERVKNGEVIMP